MRLTRRIRRDWAFAASLLAHMAVIGTVFARFAPAPVPPPPVKMEIRIAPIVTQTVAATPPPEQVVKAEPPPPIRAVEPEPEVIKSKAPEAPVVAKAPPKRPKPVPAIKPPPPRPVAIQPVRQAKVAPQPDPSPPAAPRVTAPPQDYLSRISAKLQRCKDYPRSARLRHIEGDVTLWFVIDRSGRVVDYRIARSSGHEILDEAVDAMIKKASPFPPMPDSMTQARLEITQPVTFRLR